MKEAKEELEPNDAEFAPRITICFIVGGIWDEIRDENNEDKWDNIFDKPIFE